MTDNGTVILIVNDPGDGTPFGHGEKGHRTWGTRRVVCVAAEAAQHYLSRASCRIAPPELQDADR